MMSSKATLASRVFVEIVTVGLGPRIVNATRTEPALPAGGSIVTI